MPGAVKGFETHVEAKASAFLRMNFGITKAVLYIDYPTGTCSVCRKSLPNMLPEGVKLWVLSPNKTETFIGRRD
ncbi:DddA-like double-stranded DNA deaminase toxin [Streptomyces sp. UNOC14_S4]|uniref:DddA-like double-stranded DNA deaminase toxin n=1 Tax=Streptomyces sp. UNOC14_S4 TaxID=2872340 RepID=UPI001EE5B0F3